MTFLARTRRFAKEGRGNIAVTFALVLLPMMFAIGAAVDYGRMGTTHNKLQNVADTAALAVAQEVEKGSSTTAVTNTMNAIFTAQLPAYGVSSWSASYTANTTASSVKVTVSAVIPSSFMMMLGYNTLSVSTNSEATYGKDAIEIALVLDNTGSMAWSGKLDYMKTAAKGMITSLQSSSAANLGKVSVAIVPFTVSVNVGTANDNASWMDPPLTTTSCASYGWIWTIFFWQWGCTSYTTVNQTWYGCVGERSGTYTTQNTIPVNTNSSTKYPHYYQNNCPTAALSPLTTDLAAQKTRIDAMAANGATNVAIGAMWGWNMLTPGAPLSNSVASTTANKVNKYMVLLTDGDNTQNTLGSWVTDINNYTSSICTNAKADNVTIFVIRVIDGNASLLQSCASSSSYYYDVSDPATLSTVFASILATIQKLRLSS